MRETGHPPRFSKRTSWDTTESDWSRMLARRHRDGLPVYDLTAANPTKCGFTYPENTLDALKHVQALSYDAQPKGILKAREEVCRYYQDHQKQNAPDRSLSLIPDNVFLTASTSEAYSFLFRLLCDPEDEILIAQPSYPLFDYLASLDDVRLVHYPLFYDYGWHIDFHTLREKITQRTRAIVLVHPNNPTGNFISDANREALGELCVEFNLALIVDEVFLDYGQSQRGYSFTLGEHPVLTFVMSGLSKITGLPQMKLSWICAMGPKNLLEPATNRLEVIADTFLSVSAPIQHALPLWLQGRSHIQTQIQRRVAENLAAIDRSIAAYNPINRLTVEAGWCAILRVPALASGEDFGLHLLTHAGVVIHPGNFFGLPDSGWLILSLLPQADTFASGLSTILNSANQLLSSKQIVD